MANQEQHPEVELIDTEKGPRVGVIYLLAEDPTLAKDQYWLRIGTELSQPDERQQEPLYDIGASFAEILDKYVRNKKPADIEQMDAENRRALEANRKHLEKAVGGNTTLLVKIHNGAPKVNLSDLVRGHIQCRYEKLYDPQGRPTDAVYGADGEINLEVTGWKRGEETKINLLDIVLALDQKGGQYH